MKIPFRFLICYVTVFNLILLASTASTPENVKQFKKQNDASNGGDSQKEGVYAKLFKERRKEQHLMAKQLLKSSYEKNFKLLKLAYEKIFEVITVNNATLSAHYYETAGGLGFPQADAKLQESVTLILENCCLAAESVLHFPEISYRIFRKSYASNWKPTLNWCIDYVQALPHIIDEATTKLIKLLQQEINEDLRTESFMNPYYVQKGAEKDERATHQKKPPKKLKKGPQISGGGSHKEL